MNKARQWADDTSEFKTDITELDSKIKRLNGQISDLSREKEERIVEVVELKYKVAVGRGFAGMYMDDLNIVYESLGCPVYNIGSEHERQLADKVIAKLSEDAYYSEQKIVSIGPIISDEEGVQFIRCLMFDYVELNKLTQLIEDDGVVPFNSIKSCTVKVIESGDDMIYEVN